MYTLPSDREDVHSEYISYHQRDGSRGIYIEPSLSSDLDEDSSEDGGVLLPSPLSAT